MNFNFPEGEVVLINKPLGWTSFDMVNYIRSFIRKVYNIKKIKVGHAGTLDPMATGLLIVCTGKMTKQIDQFQGMAKVYVGQMQLGTTTPSYDKETEPDRRFDISDLTENKFLKATTQFVGDIDQIPPLYSAIKINGERAYKKARRDEEVTVKPRPIHIHEFKLLNYEPPFLGFQVRCSKGTYIRSLVRDFGESLENGAYLTALIRTQIGEYSLKSAWDIESFRQEVIRQTGFTEAS